MKKIYILAGIVLAAGFMLLGIGLRESIIIQPAAQTNIVEKEPKIRQLLAPDSVNELYEPSIEPLVADTSDKYLWGNNQNYADLIITLENLSLHGLNPDHYHLEKLKTLQEDKSERDIWATDAWHSAAAHMIYGKIDPVTVEPDWTAVRRDVNITERMQYALASDNIADSLEDLAPKQPEYVALREELSRLRTLAEAPIALVPAGEAIKKGMKSGRVRALQERLVQLSLLLDENVNGEMDEQTVNALKVFQFQSELDNDGVAGTATIAALNLGVQDKINQVRVNMERARWLPDFLGKKHVRVNIAAFKTTAWNNGKVERTHLAIVGKSFRKTPVFSDEIEYMIFNPWWETPPSLARADKLPAFRRDPGAVKRLGFQVLDRSGNLVDSTTIDWNSVSASNFPYRIRQAPGELNALGKVKIMFPNPHNVYLHDTPTRDLFAKQQRAFSSGCIRTQDPLDLATWLLSDTKEWTAENINKAVASGKETRANLTAKIPVHILYNTVVWDETGGIKFLDDIYDRDSAILSALDELPSSSKL
ncbi:MAG: L,D-transpeptidase family protein [Hyphomonadaceae bacterium]|nr:L,D-transpeptidase family protein [Hyphomonadaceae bacterium]